MRLALALLLLADVNGPAPSFDPAGLGLLRTIAPLGGELFGVAFSPDGRRVAVSCAQTVRLFDTATGAELKRLEGHPNHVFSVAFSPDGTLVAGGGFEGVVWVWNAASGEAVQRMSVHAGYVTILEFSSDGAWLAAGGHKGSVWVRDLRTEEDRCLKPVGVTAAAFSRDGRRLAVVRDRSIEILRAGAWTEEKALTGPSEPREAVFLDERHLVVWAGEAVERWDADLGRKLASTPAPPAWRALEILRGGRYAAAGQEGGGLRIWDLGRGTEGPELRHHKGDVNAVAAHPSGKLLATVGADRHLKIWGPRRGGMANVKPRGFCGIVVNQDAASNVYVAQVLPGTPAAQAGLQVADVLLRIGGKAIATTTDSVDQIGSFQEDEEVEFEIRRQGLETRLRIRLGRKPPDIP